MIYYYIIVLSTWYERVIEYVSGSQYCYCSIVLKKPTFIDEKLTEEYYVFESTFEQTPDVVTGKMILGVQIQKLDDIKLLVVIQVQYDLS